MELALFGVGVVAILLTWTYIWKPTMLDEARDELFDLRDEQVREYFLVRNLGLDHKLYIALRDLINGHLRNTESLSMFRMIGGMIASANDSKIIEVTAKKIEKIFETDDLELRKFVLETRLNAIKIMLKFMIRTSSIAVLFSFIAAAVKTATLIFSATLELFRGVDNITKIAIVHLTEAFIDVARASKVGDRKEFKFAMEESALTQ